MDRVGCPGQVCPMGRNIRVADICGVFRGSEAVAAERTDR